MHLIKPGADVAVEPEIIKRVALLPCCRCEVTGRRDSRKLSYTTGVTEAKAQCAAIQRGAAGDIGPFACNGVIADDGSLSRLIPAHQRVLDDLCT